MLVLHVGIKSARDRIKIKFLKVYPLTIACIVQQIKLIDLLKYLTTHKINYITYTLSQMIFCLNSKSRKSSRRDRIKIKFIRVSTDHYCIEDESCNKSNVLHTAILFNLF